jgi:NADH-quinone oxidoreductase subunit C
MTIAMSGRAVADALRPTLNDAVISSDGIAVWIEPESIAQVCRFLHDDPEQEYTLLNSVTAVDYVEYFEIVYHLTSIGRNSMAQLKVQVYGRENPSLPSVVSIWRGAELQEREIWDLMGVAFDGHPDLKRILTWEGFNGHPLRRDYLEPPLPYTWPHGG